MAIVGNQTPCEPPTMQTHLPQAISVRRRTALAGALATVCDALMADTPSVIHISNGEWAPFMGKELPHHGFVSRIVAQAFAMEGVRVEYGFYPWARAYFLAQHGQVDASIGWYRTPERERDFLFSDAVFVESQVLFFLKEKPVAWKTLSDLRGLNIGAVLGYTYGAEFQDLEERKAVNVERTASDEQNLRKLLAGRIDAAVISLAVGERLLRTLGGDNATRIGLNPRPVNAGPLHLIFPKEQPRSGDWLRLFNRGLKRLKATGAVDRYRRED